MRVIDEDTFSVKSMEFDAHDAETFCTCLSRLQEFNQDILKEDSNIALQKKTKTATLKNHEKMLNFCHLKAE